VLSIKKRIIFITITSVLVLLPMLIGCDAETKYKILTFFFEGVPDPNAVDVNSVGRVILNPHAEKTRTVVVTNKPVDKQRRSTRHKPAKKCNNCHEGKIGLGRRTTIEPVPVLCYSCHTNYHEMPGYMHGPVIVGDCTFCHDAHQSKYVYLQKDREPDLCYRCHMKNDIGSITGHEDKLEAICTDCHDPHISLEKKLLKPIEEFIDDPNTADLGR